MLALGRGYEGCAAAGPCTGWAVEELAAPHFAGATSSSAVAGEEVAQPVDETEEPEDTAEGVAELCELVDDAGEVDSSICTRPAKVCMTE